MSFVEIQKNSKTAVLTINRPEALNALNSQVLSDLKAALDELKKEADLRCLIITGAGPKSFVAGADIGEMSTMNPKKGEAFGIDGNKVMSQVASFPCPVIAAVNGYALGGGFELALACDLRLASEKARFAFPETGLGITPGFGGTQRLARLVGPALASELIFTGRTVKADEALAKGMVSQVCAPEELLNKAQELADTIAGRAPIAIRQAKKAIRGGLDLTLEKGLDYESECFGECFDSEDQKNAMKAFVEKQPFNDFQNR
ncbi:MAG: enoyl-CoA hydratase-related protein [Clostridiales bacterium]|nr:enoyl-CoA hydratase-related protein [Clostridiales bacterium]MDD7431969.1 enoyl-CoA hydratase-related protein [Clostridiales bacterium]MDY3060954.1 enoyl-CoA hydratase-related protein [Eubacteriales bacterium]